MQRAVGDDDVDLVSVLLVVVERVVLHARRHAVALQSLDVRHHHGRREPRVLAHVLKVAPVERRAVDVDARAQQDVLAAIQGFLAKAPAIEASHVRVPCGGETGERGERHARVVALAGLHPFVPKHVGAHAVRAIVGPEVGQAKAGHATGGELALRVNHANLLVERHARERVFHALLYVLGVIEVDGQCRLAAAAMLLSLGGRRECRQHEGKGNREVLFHVVSILVYTGYQWEYCKGSSFWRLSSNAPNKKSLHASTFMYRHGEMCFLCSCAYFFQPCVGLT